MYIKPLLVIFFISLTCFACNKSNNQNIKFRDTLEPESYWLKAAGSRTNMFTKNDLSAHIDLKQLKNMKNLVALGPIENLKGEVTIYNGHPYITSLINDNQTSDSSFNYKAIFLAYGSTKEWREIVIDKPLASLSQIEDLVRKYALDFNIDLTKGFPFKIEGVATRARYHIIYQKDAGIKHTPKLHQQAKQKYTVYDEAVKIAGIWATQDGIGRYTHPGTQTHMHVILDKNNFGGHLEDIELDAGIKLFIPKVNK
jgi:acetolactate decarboxylase